MRLSEFGLNNDLSVVTWVVKFNIFQYFSENSTE